MGQLEGKVAIVTGAGSETEAGVGAATAILFAREGAAVAVVDISATRANHTVAAISEAGGTALAVVADVTDAEACSKAVAKACAQLGTVDILVNNVAIGGKAGDESVEELQRVLNANMLSMIVLSRTFIEQAAGGSIVNLSSSAAYRPPYEGSIAYPASKGGVVSLTRALAVRHGAQGIRANCICPAGIWSPMAQRFMAERSGPDVLAQYRQARVDATLLKIEGTVWDVAEAALFLASDKSRWITGQALSVDGGALLAPRADHASQREIPQR